VFEWYVTSGWTPRADFFSARDASTWTFQFEEEMSGHWYPLGGSGRAEFHFNIRSTADTLAQFLSDGRMHCHGFVTAEGIAQRALCEGTLIMPVRSRDVIIDFEFEGEAGARYVYSASKRLGLRHFVRDITTFIGELKDAEGRVLGRCEARFDLRKNLRALVTSIRLQA
jgi:hypothetical protein